MIRRSQFVGHLALLSLLFLAGCGGGGEPPYRGPQRFAVSGKVTFDGMPLDGGTISFVGVNKESNATGGQISKGEYSVIENEGPNAGSYKVVINWLKPTGEKVPDEDMGGTKDVVKEAIPAKYNTATELKAEVSKDKTKFDFNLTSK